MTAIDPGSFGRALFISPHLDDAAFACGELIARLPEALVATVFAGEPAAAGTLTEWDRAAGFGSSHEALAGRREEDREAIGQLGAWPIWLNLNDAQYGPSPAVADVAQALRRLLVQCEPEAVFFPLGLFHGDHRLARRAAAMLARACSGCDWFVYEDALYRNLPGESERGRQALRRDGIGLAPFVFAPPDAGAVARKRRAVACYRSQLRALGTPGRLGTGDLAAPETYWQALRA